MLILPNELIRSLWNFADVFYFGGVSPNHLLQILLSRKWPSKFRKFLNGPVFRSDYELTYHANMSFVFVPGKLILDINKIYKYI